MKPTVALAVFTNCTNDILTAPTIHKTLRSYFNVLKPNHETVKIYCDPYPNEQYITDYLKDLKKTGFDVTITKSLSDGYRKALDLNADYLFMLEHDWLFIKERITHKLDEIIKIMERDNLWFMGFNRLMNDESLNDTKWQTYFHKRTHEYCLTDRVSNNPHVINRKYYLEHIAPLIDWTVKGAGYIEQRLQKNGHEVAIYGNFGLEPTLIHLDGRKGGKK